MNTYVVYTTDGYAVRIVSDSDPSNHPAFFGRLDRVEIIS